MRDRTQFGGCNGGGATSWDQRERLRSVRNTEFALDIGGAGSGQVSLVEGKISLKYVLVISIIPSRESISSKFRRGCDMHLLASYKMRKPRTGPRIEHV